MEFKDKIIVITGGAGGIGKAMAKRFLQDKPKQVIISDLNGGAAEQAAAELGCVAKTVDVGKEDDIRTLIESVEQDIGPIDLFCSNAGIMGGPTIDSDNSVWQASWDINVMAHVYAARHLVPLMAKRGGGYFLHTASAAGLLNQIGGASYGVTKHAAVGFAEWLAIHHAEQGIKVSLLCPQAVRTAMTADATAASKAAAGDGMMEPEQLANIVAENLREENFLILPHPEVLDYMQRKTADYGRWISGMQRLYQRLKG